MILSAYSHPAAEVDVPELSAQPLDVVALLAQAHHPRAGAIVLFSGEVRNHNDGMAVDYLEYEAHEAMAAKMINQIIIDAKHKFPLNIAVAQHRTGKVAVGETAVIVITASAHRAEAYAANQYIIDRVKHEATIWKCEYFSDGTKKWGGNCSCCPRPPEGGIE
jgi:molybdopterin synthase catalytic subunit